MICLRCNKEIPDDAAVCCYCARPVKPVSRKAHRRGNGTGTARKRGRTWTSIITVGWEVMEDGRRKQVVKTKGGFRTRSEALEYCTTLRNMPEGERKCPSLQHYWDTYRKDDLLKLSDSKQTAYEIAWKKLRDIRFRPVSALTIAEIRKTVHDNAKTYYPARDMKSVLGHLFDMARADGFLVNRLPDFIILPDLNEKERQPFTDEEQAALWKRYDAGDRRAAIPLIMIYTGMMPGEMQSLKCDMVNFGTQQIIGAGMKTKVRKQSPVYIPDAIVPILEEEIARSVSKSGYIWPRNEKAFYENYYNVLAEAGCRRLEPYSCRHTTATALAVTEGIAPQTVKKIMRWSSTKMLDKYAHPSDKDAAEAINAIRKGESL